VEVGESFYKSKIPSLIEELKEKKLLENDDGRWIIRTKGINIPLTVIKSDGGYTYDTTDLATIKYRLCDLKVDEIYYVVGSEQADHFKQLIDVAKKAGWLTNNQKVEHIGFGMVLDENNKRFRSRDGGAIKLIDLLDTGLVEANKALVDKQKKRGKVDNPEDVKEDNTQLNKTVAYGAIKYANLSTQRTLNYAFSFERMLSFDGNTASYLLYSYVRISAVIEKTKTIDILAEHKGANKLEDSDFDIMKHLLKFPEVVNNMTNTLFPHLLCTYMYKLSDMINQYYKSNRIINYGKDKKTIIDINYARLIMMRVTKKIMKQCFDILGMDVLEKM